MRTVTLPPLTLSPTIPRDADVIVVGLAEASATDVLTGVPEEFDKAHAKRFGSRLLEQALALGASSKPGRVRVLTSTDGVRVAIVGLGPIDVTPEQVRRAAGAAVRAAADLAGDTPLRVTISLDTVEPEVVKGAAEGALLGAYRCPKITAETADDPIAQLTIVSTSNRSEVRRAVEIATTVAAGVCLARDWVNAPANVLFPESFADDVRARAKEAKLSVDVWDDKALEKEGYGGLMAVGGGSTRKPRLVRLSYAPRGARFHLALVGKGITFDSGGLNLKPGDSMYTMKCDMAGAAAILAATRAIAQLGLKIKVTAYAALAENLPSGSSYRPSDVLTIYGGTTVENGNSDAEGRLVLADALARAGEDQPAMIVDVATLTGACVVALGERVAGLMASDDQTADSLLDAAEAAGETFWQLPIPDETRAKLDSRVADIKSTADRWGGALTAAAFLREFVADEVPWAHLDIAGPAFNTHDPYDYVPVGGTGAAVRTLVALAHQLQG